MSPHIVLFYFFITATKKLDFKRTQTAPRVDLHLDKIWLHTWCKTVIHIHYTSLSNLISLILEATHEKLQRLRAKTESI